MVWFNFATMLERLGRATSGFSAAVRSIRLSTGMADSGQVHDAVEEAPMAQPRTRLAATVIESPDPRGLAAFYEQLLGWNIAVSEPARPGSPPEDGWVILRPPAGGAALSFQFEPDYVTPVW